MKKFLFGCFVMGFALFSQMATAQEWNKIIIASEGAYKPFNYFDKDGNLVGFEVELAKALCDAVNVECEIVSQEWSGMIPSLLAGKYDAIIASMSITEERKKAIAFSDKYYHTPGRFLISNTTLDRFKQSGVDGFKVGVQKATIYAEYLEIVYKDKIDLVYYETQDNANLDLFSGRLDAVVADSVVLNETVMKSKPGQYQFVGEPLKDPKYFGIGAGVGMRKQDTELHALFNKAIKIVRENGKYKEINDKYFPFDVYGE